MNRKKLEEIAKEKGKILLCESTTLSIKKEDIEIFDKPLMESVDGNTISCKGILKNVPVSKYTRNDNNRIYGRHLWENIYKQKTAENSLSLMDHPEDEGSVKDICGVWKNMRLGEDYVLADWLLVGSHGQLLIEVVNAGGKIGISSVGYGEFEEDNITVNPTSFELSRLGDAVVNPSQNVYAAKENIISDEKVDDKVEKIEENAKNNEILTESITNNIYEYKKSNTFSKEENIKQEVNDTMERINEANFKNHVLASIKEAKKCKNIPEGLDILKTLDVAGHEYLAGKVDDAISELQEKLEEQKNTAEKNAEQISQELSEMKAKYDVASKSLDQLKENYQKAKSIIEKAGIKEDANVENIVKEAAENKKKISNLIESKKNMIGDMKQLIEDRRNMFKDLKSLAEDRKVMKTDLNQLLNDRKNMKSDISSLLEKYNTLKKKYSKIVKKLKEEGEEGQEDEAYKFDFDSNDDEAKNDVAVEEPIEEEDDEEMIDEIPSDEEPIEEDDEPITVGDPDVYTDEETPLHEYDDEEITIEEDDEEFNFDKPTDEEPIEEGDEPITVGAPGVDQDESALSEDDEESVIEEEDEDDEEIPMEEDDDEEIPREDEDIIAEDDDDEPVIEDDEEEKKEPIIERKKIIRSEIQKLYMMEAKKYPALKNIQKHLFKSSSVVEAVSKINKFKESRKSKNVKPMQIKSGVQQKPDWLLGRK